MKPALNRTQFVLLYLAGWLPFFVFYALGMRQTAAPNLLTAALWTCTYLAPAILTGLLLWRIGSRLPWAQFGWPKFVAVEIGFALWFIAQWHVLFYGYLALVETPHAALDLAKNVLVWQVFMAVLVSTIHSVVFHTARITGELRAKELAAAEAETARARSEMLALRGQLDPHFLFNSLHSITALVREDPRRAEDALLQFSALLRRVLAVKRDSTDEVTLADELKFVDDYLAIERLRLGDRLHVKSEISAEARACLLPAFSVQPLVENSIRHALEPRRDGGTLTLRAAVRDGRLEILVHDDGPGAQPGALENATGVGLSVIRQRLQLRHGPRAELTIDTAPGRGFGVTLVLPAECRSDFTSDTSGINPDLPNEGATA